MTSDEMKTYLLARITEMIDEREKKHIVPPNVPYKQLLASIVDDVKNALNGLYRDGAITVSKTIDDNTIGLKD